MTSHLIQNATLVTPTEQLKVDVLVVDGRIETLAFHDQPGYALPSIPNGKVDEMIDASGLLLFPGFIDCHVHFREPGLTHKATMKSEAAAARAGGITTVCEMPNTVPPTVTIAALADKVRRASEVDDCDLRFFFGITEEAHLHALRELFTGESAELRRLRGHCCGVKLYLDHSTGNQKVAEELLDNIFRTCAELSIPIVAHCEDPETNAKAAAAVTGMDVSLHSPMRPPESEKVAIKRALDLVRSHGAQFHVAHLSTSFGIDLVAEAKKDGLPVTCEVTPHHLCLTTDDYAHLGTLAKVNPPIRPREHMEALWRGIAEGVVDCVATDHAPHTMDEKKAAESLKAPSGLPGVETNIPLLLTAASEKKLSPHDILRLCFENPNRIFALGKQGVKEGEPADLVLIDPSAQWVIKGSDLHSLCGWTPFEGWKATGKIVRVIR